MLEQLLAAVGIEAQLALVASHGCVRDEIPSVDQFNHMFVYCPGVNRFLDPTARRMTASAPAPLGLAGAVPRGS
ncbi:MAG: hypothetical protein U1E76_14430 [Planctomycetota bacterium]